MKRSILMLALATMTGINSMLIRAAHAAPAAVAYVVDSLRGRVVADDGTPLGATVSLVVPATGKVVARTRTDRNGRYAIGAPRREGGYVLRIVSIGYKPVTRPVAWGDGGGAPGGDVAMRAVAASSGGASGGGVSESGVRAAR